MATLVLGAVGSAVGGPLGGAVGALLGQSLDQGFFGSPRRGPRLGDLSVQTSSYGNVVPKLFGTLRVAGTIVWATDIKERAADTGGYAYSASFAVALSSRPIRSVRRIWADGKLLRGAEGDFKVRTDFRLHNGSDDQSLDPLIAAVEGIDDTPAYRGVALAVFEDLELADFGNRIPSLTFEVQADDFAPSLGALLREASDDVIRSEVGTSVPGYAVHGSDMASALAPLIDLFGMQLAEDEGVLRQPVARIEYVVPRAELGCSMGGDLNVRREQELAAESDCPRRVSLTYYDPARDFQAGQSQATIEGGGRQEMRLALPVVLSARDAKVLTEAVLSRQWLERTRLTVHLPLRYFGLVPGDIVRIEGEQVSWRVVQCTLEAFVMKVVLVRAEFGDAWKLAADPGRAVRQIDAVAVPTMMELIELAGTSGTSSGDLALHVALAGGSTPFRAVPLDVEVAGAAWTQLSAGRPSVMGQALTVLAETGSAPMDTTGAIVVQLAPSDWLTGCDDQALAAGANTAVIGAEVIQFGRAEALGGGQFQLSKLLRGRRGTEAAAAGHRAGERFVLLDARALSVIRLPLAAVGATVRVRARGIADGEGRWIEYRVMGASGVSA